MGGASSASDSPPAASTGSPAVEGRIRAHFTDRIDWSDPEQALDTAGVALCDLGADSGLLLEAVKELSVDQLSPHLGVGGAYWFLLAKDEENDHSIWIRFCPTGCVAPAHAHRSDVLALVVSGTFKQTLIGRGGGVSSSDHPIELYVRHESPGQVFALNTLQEHATSSTAGSLLLAAMPASAAAEFRELPSDQIDAERIAKGETAIRRLGRSAKGTFGGDSR